VSAIKAACPELSHIDSDLFSRRQDVSHGENDSLTSPCRSFALAVLSPLLLLIVLSLETNWARAKYSTSRSELDGTEKPFRICKFATMLENSPNLPGGDITVGRDPRILPLGHFLRKDEAK